MPRARALRDAPGLAPSPARTRPLAQDPPRAVDSLGDSRVFNALGSRARLQILSSLASGEKTIAELAKELQAHRITVRYHVNQLLNQGLVEETRGPSSGHAGRPPIRYRPVQHARVEGFPPRKYEFLGKIALETLRETLGDRRCTDRLREKGAQNGRAMMTRVAEAHEVRKWTPEAFQRLVLEGAFREQGASVQVLSRTPRDIVYRASGCPFLELAESMPDLVCEGLDSGFHLGMDEVLGSETERLTCMAHGAPYCEYRMTWPAKRRRRITTRLREATKAPAAAPA
ncbi:MAG TPA: ArsR family transcriptional regulator [Thermoplasmata archaeon]|nr:ArsR family transcriptional regulator [Thermoplasmata archaeon]